MKNLRITLGSRAGGQGLRSRPILLRLCGLCAILFCAASASAQDYLSESEPKRVALVIGNENYRHLAPLASARADGEMMAQRLRALDFEVDYYADVATVEQFEDEIIPAFRAKLTRGAFVVFYFSGHGFSYGPDNFLAPTRLPLSIHKTMVTRYAIAVDSFRDLLATYRPGFVLFLLDACRSLGGFVISDEFGRNVVTKGYKEPENSPRGVNAYVAYATQPGEVAAGFSTPGQMSRFTQGLYDSLGAEGEPFFSVIRNVGAWVLAISQGEQDPDGYGLPKTDPYFKPTPQNLEDQRRIWLAALETRDALRIEIFFHRYSVSRHAAASRKWLADDLYKEKSDPHTAFSPTAVERAWRAPGATPAGIRGLALTSLAFKRSVTEKQEQTLRAHSDEEIGLLTTSAPQAGDPLEFSVVALSAHGTVVTTRDLEARAAPDASTAAARVPAGSELLVQGSASGTDGNTYVRVLTRDADASLFVNLSKLLEKPKLLYLGQSLVEVVAPPRADGNRDLVDAAAIEDAIGTLKAQGLKITWVSLSTAAVEGESAEAESERAARALRLADAVHTLKRAGVEGTRVTTVSGRDDFTGDGVRIRFFGIR